MVSFWPPPHLFFSDRFYLWMLAGRDLALLFLMLRKL